MWFLTGNYVKLILILLRQKFRHSSIRKYKLQWNIFKDILISFNIFPVINAVILNAFDYKFFSIMKSDFSNKYFC